MVVKFLSDHRRGHTSRSRWWADRTYFPVRHLRELEVGERIDRVEAKIVNGETISGDAYWIKLEVQDEHHNRI